MAANIVMIPNVRCRYVHLLAMHAYTPPAGAPGAGQAGQPRYSVEVMTPVGSDVHRQLATVVGKLVQEHLSYLPPHEQASLQPLRVGDEYLQRKLGAMRASGASEEAMKKYADANAWRKGAITFRAGSTNQPAIAKSEPNGTVFHSASPTAADERTFTPNDVYPGMMAALELNVSFNAKSAPPRIVFYVNSVLVLPGGERMSGGEVRDPRAAAERLRSVSGTVTTVSPTAGLVVQPAQAAQPQAVDALAALGFRPV